MGMSDTPGSFKVPSRIHLWLPPALLFDLGTSISRSTCPVSVLVSQTCASLWNCSCFPRGLYSWLPLYSNMAEKRLIPLPGATILLLLLSIGHALETQSWRSEAWCFHIFTFKDLFSILCSLVVLELRAKEKNWCSGCERSCQHPGVRLAALCEDVNFVFTRTDLLSRLEESN